MQVMPVMHVMQFMQVLLKGKESKTSASVNRLSSYLRCAEMDLIIKMICCNSGRVGFRFDSLRQEKRDLAIDSRQNLLGSLLRPQK